MAKFKITKETTAGGLKKQFADEIGGTLRVYDGRSQAEDDVILVSLGAKIGELECRTSRTVGRFEEIIQQGFNLKVKVYTIDDWVHVLGGVTLENVAKIRRQSTRANMEQYIAYRRYVQFPPKNPLFKDEEPVIEEHLPCPWSVLFYEKKRLKLQNYVNQELALTKLFEQLCPTNDQLTDILIKCSTLNDFYSTNIYDVHSVALHYHNIHKKTNIDKRLKDGDESLVNELADVIVGGKHKNFYSFATKYCSHHRPEVYPIYDSFVGKMLTYFLNRDGFVKFAQNDLKDYPKFVDIINAFKKFYGLDDFSLLQIDNYLWLLGKDAEQEKLEKKNSQSL